MTKEQKEQVNKAMDMVWNDSKLQPAKYKFCEALRLTIRGDYLDSNKAEQEARIAIWRACVSVLFHDHKITSDDRKEILSNPVQRKKFFVTWLFNYLKQILRENKIPSIKNTSELCGPSPHVCSQVVKSFIEFKGYSVDESFSNGQFVLSGINQLLWPLSLSLDILHIVEDYKKYKVEAVLDYDCIKIGSSVEDPPIISGKFDKIVRVRSASLDHKVNDDDGGNSLRYSLEYKFYESNKKTDEGLIQSDALSIIRNRLPEHVKPVFDVIVNAPEAYVKQHGDKTAKSKIAKFLGISTKDVEDCYRIMRTHWRLIS